MDAQACKFDLRATPLAAVTRCLTSQGAVSIISYLGAQPIAAPCLRDAVTFSSTKHCQPGLHSPQGVLLLHIVEPQLFRQKMSMRQIQVRKQQM